MSQPQNKHMIYFLSDAHLGSRAIANPETHQQTLIDMLQNMAKDATAIYLLGDIFDFWCEYFWRDRSKAQYHPFLQTLQEITSQGIDIHFFIGNHDLWTFGWLEKVTGIAIHRGPESMIIGNRKVLLAHGDGLIPSSNFLKRYRRKFAISYSCEQYFTIPFCNSFFAFFLQHGVMLSAMNGLKRAV